MTVDEARDIVDDFDENTSPSDEDVFVFTEAIKFLIDEEKSPKDMMYLGGYYYEIKQFDLALKYYEMAASYDYDGAYECLGYIWYYGRTGERNYEKAFYYFNKMMEKGHLVATYKVADMYKNGYYVEKNQAKYEEIIEDLYLKVVKCRNAFDPIPEVNTRLAKIRVSQGKIDEAINLYLRAKRILSLRIKYNAFFGNLNIMKWLIDDLYELIEFDEENFDLYDLYYILKTPHKVAFAYEDQNMIIESVMEGSECTVCFNGKWFHNRDEFFGKAMVDGEKITVNYDEFYDFKVVI